MGPHDAAQLAPVRSAYGCLAGGDTLFIVEGRRKTSALFVALLGALLEEYPESRVMHVILGNFRIHHSRIVQAALRAFGGRIQLHFLPPYFAARPSAGGHRSGRIRSSASA